MSEIKLGQPVPELPVADVGRAQEYYRDISGCKIEWNRGGEIGAVSNAVVGSKDCRQYRRQVMGA